MAVPVQADLLPEAFATVAPTSVASALAVCALGNALRLHVVSEVGPARFRKRIRAVAPDLDANI